MPVGLCGFYLEGWEDRVKMDGEVRIPGFPRPHPEFGGQTLESESGRERCTGRPSGSQAPTGPLTCQGCQARGREAGGGLGGVAAATPTTR